MWFLQISDRIPAIRESCLAGLDQVFDIFFFWIFVIFLAPVIVAIAALVRTNTTRSELRRVALQLTDIQSRLDDLGTDVIRGAAPIEPEEANVPSVWADGPSGDFDEEGPVEEEAIEEEPGPPVPDNLVAPQGVAARSSRAARLERDLASRWLVWLGGVALAFAGIFLVTYAIEQGWLGPTQRVVLGLLMGGVLTLGGEWLRRRPIMQAIASIQPNYVPPALSAAGIFTAFGSIYAAYDLYGLITPLVAFAGLAVVALGGVALSLLQGWFVALLGLLGAFLTPALASTGAHSVWELFTYLLFVEAACLALVRYKGWWWLGYSTLVGSALWPLLWVTFEFWESDVYPLGMYLLIVVALFQQVRRGYDIPERPEDLRQEWAGLTKPEVMGWCGIGAGLVLMALMVEAANYGTASLIFYGLLAVVLLFYGRREAAFDLAFVFAGAVLVLLMIGWPIYESVAGVVEPVSPDGPGDDPFPDRSIALALWPFTVAALSFGALFGLGGLAVLWGAKRPAVWAGASAFTPVLLLLVAFWRFLDFGQDLNWAVAALALAGLALGAASWVERYRVERGLELSLGFYAAAVLGFLGLAAAMSLEHAWLTVAISLELVGLAWVERHVPVRFLRYLGVVLASLVLIRLVLNPNVFRYELGFDVVSNWLLYGYGVPAAAFYWAARQFALRRDDYLVTLLETGALVFFVLLVSFEIRLLVTGAIDSARYDLFEQSLQAITWLSVAYGVLREGQPRRFITVWGSALLVGLATIQIVELQLFASNPIWTQKPVGELMVFNQLLLAYGAPAVFAFLLAPRLGATFHPRLAYAAQVLGFLLAFVYVNLEVRHVFQGSVLQSTHQSDAEFYTYSVVWLVFALALLLPGIVLKRSALRYASLVVLMITVTKVFLADMADLTGLFRVASFLGLGLSLVGIGYLYQRFVFPYESEPDESAG